MKEQALKILILLFIFATVASGTMLQAIETRPGSQPVAYLPKTVFESPDTVEGENIIHDFVIRNSGSAALHVKRGTSACGYTVSSVPGPIPPGGEGIITVLFSTYGCGGKNLKKTIRVITNDPENANIPLTVKARIIKPYTLNPENVKLKGRLGKTIKKTLNLAPTDDNPFTIQEITAKRGRHIRFDLEEIKKRDRVKYKLTVENTAETPGIYYDTLYVKTDSNLKPIISITVIGKIGKSI